MRVFDGRITEIRLEYSGNASAWITFPSGAGPGLVPTPGQYFMAWDSSDKDAPLATPLFPGGISERGIRAEPPFPGTWEPGAVLQMYGPLGRGFKFPRGQAIRRLALVALGETVGRLVPLAVLAAGDDCAVTLFTDSPLPSLPSDLEIYPLSSLPEALSWADFIALDLPASHIPGLRNILGLNAGTRLPCPAQALVLTSLPCGGIAGCGACAIPSRLSWKLACKDGPVFNLDDLDW